MPARTSLRYKDKAPKVPGKNETKLISYSQIIDQLHKSFTFPREEITRLANCIFHLILKELKQGNSVKIPYFGMFYGEWYGSKRLYNLSTGLKLSKHILTFRCKPQLYPAPYTTCILSPKDAFNLPSFFARSTSQLYSANSLARWYKDQLLFTKRDLMLQDNPYETIVSKYTHKESTQEVYNPEINLVEYEAIKKSLNEKVFQDNKHLLNRFMLKQMLDYNPKYSGVFTYHNYLPNKWYVGTPFNFENTVKEKELNKWFTLLRRKELMMKKFINYKAPLRTPKDFDFNFFTLEKYTKDLELRRKEMKAKRRMVKNYEKRMEKEVTPNVFNNKRRRYKSKKKNT